MDYVTAIRAEIDHHYEEIAKLQTALEVLARIKPDKDAKPAKQTPLFTVKRIAPALAAPKGQERRRTIKEEYGKSSVDIVREVFAASDGPLKSGAIIDALGWRNISGKPQRVYSALNQMSAAGEVSRDPAGFYFLVRSDRGGSGESPQPDSAPNAESELAA